MREVYGRYMGDIREIYGSSRLETFRERYAPHYRSPTPQLKPAPEPEEPEPEP